MSLIQKIKDYYKNGKSILFTTPSHNQGSFIIDESRKMLGEQFFKCDFSEIDGFDNLRSPQDTIKNIMNKASSIYDTKATFLLTNGSTSGIIAAMMSVLRNKDEVLIARNCHVSVYNALVMTGAKPIWFTPKFNSEWSVFEGVQPTDIETILENNPKIKALIITSPTYEGLFSDVTEISKITKKFGVKLIVDEAHGALLNFGKFKTKPSVNCGADISIQSLHKTAGAPNPCALLHLSKESDVSPDKIQEALNLITTTSPSYPLLVAIESTINYLNSDSGRKNVNDLIDTIRNIKLPANVIRYDAYSDPTKLLIKINGVSATTSSFFLNSEFNIEEEFSNNKSMLFITGIGTTKNKLQKLQKALEKLSKSLKRNESSEQAENFQLDIPQVAISPRKAYFSKNKKVVNKVDAENRISAEVIMSYPPGIPLVLPGEILTSNVIKASNKNEFKICD